MTVGRSRRRYALARLRLVNFHNFVDEVLEVADAGHLFLLGDNASGKTTLLDALHLAFSGGEGVELNAAARVGGRRDQGRSLAGIVLRQDAEHGVRNAGGAVAYAVVELRSLDDEARPLCLGLGMEATTLDAGVSRWGLLTPRPLEELSLLEEDDAGRSPLGREELRQRLDKGEVFGRITDYRRAVAERLFAGPDAYEEVCRFWAMAKAYREIVARARDFESLFMRLLPAPEAGVFHEILRSLRELADLGVQLDGLREQVDYVAALLESCRTIAIRREERARYEWLATHLELEAEDRAMAQLDAALAERERRLAALEAETAVMRAALERAEVNLREAEAQDGSELFEKLARARRTLGERRAERSRAEQREREVQTQRAASQTGLRDSVDDYVERLDAWRAGVVASMDRTRELPNELPALTALLDSVATTCGRLRDEVHAEPVHALDLPPPVEAELEQLAQRLRQRERDAADALALAKAELSRAEERVARARDADEVAPEVVGLREGLEALAEVGVAATPLYRALEPRRDALALHLAALEVLAGEATLGAVYVAPDDRARAADVLARRAPNVRLFVRAADDATLPGWALRLLLAPSDAAAEAALAALAAALSQPASLGAIPAPDALAALEQRGLSYRLTRELPCYLGAEARERERRHRVEWAEERAEAARAAEIEASSALGTAQGSSSRAHALQTETRALTARALLDGAASVERARAELLHLDQRVLEAQAGTLEASRAEALAEEAFAALDARARELGLDALRAQLEKLRARRDEAKERLEAHQRGVGGEQAMLTRDRESRQAHAERAERLKGALDVRAKQLRAALAAAEPTALPESDEELTRYVLVRQRGQQFSRRENVEARLEEVKRDHDRRVAELEGDGSGGVRNVGFAARFGFGWDATSNTLRDRRGEPGESVLAELNHTVKEQESVVHEGTRELMERLIMGSLLGHLRDQVSSLDRLVRDINRLLSGLRFGRTRYQFRISPRGDRKEIVETVKKVSLLDEASRERFRAFVEDRMDELREADDDGSVPELLDYRCWYDYRLTMRTQGEDDVELSRELRRLGSGGEQGVPNYLLVLALAKLMNDSAKARVRPLFFDEAFYGIDAMRRDELLRFATELGLQLVVASPDQDGVTRAVDRSTTLFVLKDEFGDVHLAPYDYQNHAREAQPGLFDEGPEESPAEDAHCVLRDG